MIVSITPWPVGHGPKRTVVFLVVFVGVISMDAVSQHVLPGHLNNLMQEQHWGNATLPVIVEVILQLEARGPKPIVVYLVVFVGVTLTKYANHHVLAL